MKTPLINCYSITTGIVDKLVRENMLESVEKYFCLKEQVEEEVREAEGVALV